MHKKNMWGKYEDETRGALNVFTGIMLLPLNSHQYNVNAFGQHFYWHYQASA